MATRYYVINRGMHEDSQPWVLFETPDRSIAEEEVGRWNNVLLSEDEALLDPEYRDVVLRWQAGDDSAYEKDAREEQVEIEMNDAIAEAEYGSHKEMNRGINVDDWLIPPGGPPDRP